MQTRLHRKLDAKGEAGTDIAVTKLLPYTEWITLLWKLARGSTGVLPAKLKDTHVFS